MTPFPLFNLTDQSTLLGKFSPYSVRVSQCVDVSFQPEGASKRGVWPADDLSRGLRLGLDDSRPLRLLSYGRDLRTDRERESRGIVSNVQLNSRKLYVWALKALQKNVINYSNHHKMETYLTSSATYESESRDETSVSMTRIIHAKHQKMRYRTKFQCTSFNSCNMKGWERPSCRLAFVYAERSFWCFMQVKPGMNIGHARVWNWKELEMSKDKELHQNSCSWRPGK